MSNDFSNFNKIREYRIDKLNNEMLMCISNKDYFINKYFGLKSNIKKKDLKKKNFLEILDYFVEERLKNQKKVFDDGKPALNNMWRLYKGFCYGSQNIKLPQQMFGGSNNNELNNIPPYSEVNFPQTITGFTNRVSFSGRTNIIGFSQLANYNSEDLRFNNLLPNFISINSEVNEEFTVNLDGTEVPLNIYINNYGYSYGLLTISKDISFYCYQRLNTNDDLSQVKTDELIILKLSTTQERGNLWGCVIPINEEFCYIAYYNPMTFTDINDTIIKFMTKNGVEVLIMIVQIPIKLILKLV